MSAQSDMQRLDELRRQAKLVREAADEVERRLYEAQERFVRNEPVEGEYGPLTFKTFRRINVERVRRWHPNIGGHDDEWTGADWGNALAGEVGEACNIIKKLRRQDMAIQGASDPSRDTLLEMLADELGDIFCYLDLTAWNYGIDLERAVAEKFNKISEREDFPERMPVPPTMTARDQWDIARKEELTRRGRI